MDAYVAELLDRAGGLQQDRRLKTWLPGGTSTGFLLPEHLELPLDFDSIANVGSRLGTGLMMAVPEDRGMVSLMRNLEEFFARESCGWCTPCRDGLPWVERILTNLEAGKGNPGDIELLELHTKLLGPGKTFCAHAPGAMGPLESGLKYFRDELAALIPDDATTPDSTQAANAVSNH